MRKSRFTEAQIIGMINNVRSSCCHRRLGQRLYRSTGAAQQLAQGRLASWRPRLRRQLVQTKVERQGDKVLYSRPQAAKNFREIRHTTPQTPQPSCFGYEPRTRPDPRYGMNRSPVQLNHD